jgi:hypothetical protein
LFLLLQLIADQSSTDRANGAADGRPSSWATGGRPNDGSGGRSQSTTGQGSLFSGAQRLRTTGDYTYERKQRKASSPQWACGEVW